jgi:hypothetical protein
VAVKQIALHLGSITWKGQEESDILQLPDVFISVHNEHDRSKHVENVHHACCYCYVADISLECDWKTSHLCTDFMLQRWQVGGRDQAHEQMASSNPDDGNSMTTSTDRARISRNIFHDRDKEMRSHVFGDKGFSRYEVATFVIPHRVCFLYHLFSWVASLYATFIGAIFSWKMPFHIHDVKERREHELEWHV